MSTMPELPEVETVVRQLRPLFVGATISGVAVHWRRTIACPSFQAFRRGLIGRTCVGIWRRAKYLVFELDDGRKLVGHLRMTGRFHVGDEPEPDHVRVSCALSDGRHFVFSDVRKFGRLGLVRSLDEILPALGPEPLSDAFNADWLTAALRQRKRLLKPLLLDQSFLAGLGNIYVDEALYRSRLHPLRMSHTLRRTQATTLAAEIKAVLGEAIDADGSSFDVFYRTPEGQPGAFQDDFAVYGRDGLPCRRCGTIISRLVVGQRGTHVCRRCQAPPRRSSRSRRSQNSRLTSGVSRGGR
jgi:formamidopyrimidine-DNA glycosylase